MSNATAPTMVAHRPVVNLTSDTITLHFAEGPNQIRPVLFPPDTPVEVPAAYATPQAIAANRDPKPSVVDMLSNGRIVDLSDKRAAAVRKRIEDAAAKAKPR